MSQRKIILFTNIDTDRDFRTTLKVGETLKNTGWQTVLCPISIEDSKELCLSGLDPPPGYHFSRLEQELDTAEMLITFGGDGTILRAARAASDHGVPILGINLGGKGFIAELEANETELLKSITNGEFNIETRVMLDVEVLRDGDVITQDFALNDIVVKGDNKVIDMTIYGDKQKITRFSGDGTVIATPTGSTAYSMSAGGPIVDPAAKNIIITPICAHVLEARSFVLVLGRTVTVELGSKKSNPAYISVDGGSHIRIQSGDTVKVFKSKRNTHLVRLSDKSFYRKVSEKLGERE